MKPISAPKSLMEVTAQSIREAIISGELPLGQKLSEQRLADTLNVSRSPVRDAFAALQSEGLVVISPKRGTFVFTPNLRSVAELCEHRAVMESAAARLGIERNYESLIENMSDSLAVMNNAIRARNPSAYNQGDEAFHKAIIDSCENASIIDAYSRATGPLRALRTHFFTYLKARSDESIQEHQQIFQACQSKDSQVVGRLLEQHINHFILAFQKVSESQP